MVDLPSAFGRRSARDNSPRRPSRSLSSSEDHIDPGKDQGKFRARQLPDALSQCVPIQRHHLGDIRHRVLRKSRNALRKSDVARCVRPPQVACQRRAHGGRDAAAIESVSLNHHYRPPVTRAGSGWRGKVRPPDLTLRDHHSLLSSTRRLAAETNSSVGCPSSAQTRSIASVTSSCACRATYSRTASLNNWLRDFLVRRASRSAPSNTSSGIDTAVFIPPV